MADGNYLSTACQAAGITPNTYRSWLERGEAGEEPYTAFFSVLKTAEAEAEALHVKKIAKAIDSGPQYWPASMTLLERRHPERFGKTDRHKIEQDKPLQITIEIVPGRELLDPGYVKELPLSVPLIETGDDLTITNGDSQG